MVNVNKFSLFEVHCQDKVVAVPQGMYQLENGTESHGCLFINDNGRLEFEGNVEESARVFFEECLKPMCEKYIELLIDKRNNPLFYWKENSHA